MATSRKDKLCDTNSSLYVLSLLMHHSEYITDDRYPLTYTDFPNQLQQLIFAAIANAATAGATHCTPNDIDTYLQQYDEQYNYYKQNGGFDFLINCYQFTEGTDIAMFGSAYDRIKKFALLRDLEDTGIDTTCFYNTEDILNMDKQDAKLNSTPIGDILKRIEEKLAQLTGKHVGKKDKPAQSIALGLRELMANLAETPEVGLPIDGTILNFATSGARRGKLYTYSAGTGVGKTRFMVGNACALSMPYINESGKIVTRDDLSKPVEESMYRKVIFITTEQQFDEIQTLVLAYVSGVNESHITRGQLNPVEKQRVGQALAIIDKYADNFVVDCIPDPSIQVVKARIISAVVQQHIEYVFYDYIFTSPGLIAEYGNFGIREDVALMMLSNTLKEIAATHDVFIQSATQLNEKGQSQATGLRDQTCIRGSKAIADKIDVGMIGAKISAEERDKIKPILDANPGCNPNRVVDIYKNRRGELNGVKIWREVDLGTCRSKDCFITTDNYEQIKNPGDFKFDQYEYSFSELVSKGVVNDAE